MGWEERRGKLFYYRKQRDETGRVRSIYCGTGERAEQAAREDEARRSTTKDGAANNGLVANPAREVETVRKPLKAQEIGVGVAGEVANIRHVKKDDEVLNIQHVKKGIGINDDVLNIQNVKKEPEIANHGNVKKADESPAESLNLQDEKKASSESETDLLLRFALTTCCPGTASSAWAHGYLKDRAARGSQSAIEFLAAHGL